MTKQNNHDRSIMTSFVNPCKASENALTPTKADLEYPWTNKDNHIKKETLDKDNNETFKSIYGDSNPQTQKTGLYS